MYWPSILFILACLQFAIYNAYSIKGKSNTWAWHVMQWVSVFLFVSAGYHFGTWAAISFTFHTFGEIIAIAVLGVPVYVGTLHIALKMMDNSL